MSTTLHLTFVHDTQEWVCPLINGIALNKTAPILYTRSSTISSLHHFPAILSFYLFLLLGVTFLISHLLLTNWMLQLPMLLLVLLLILWCCLISPTPVSNLRSRKRLNNPSYLQNPKSNPSLKILHWVIIASSATPFKESWVKVGCVSVVLIFATLIAMSVLGRSRSK